MAQDNKIKLALEVLLKDKNFKSKLKESENAMKKSASKQKGFISTIKKSWIGIGIAVGGAAIAIKKAFDLTKTFQEYKQGMKALARNTGQNADIIVAKLAEVSKGTVANKDLMLAANRAVALNVTKDVGDMAKLLEVSRVKAKAMGIDTTQAFNDIVTGIGRNSPLILDNLGIITKGWADEAKAAGKAMDQQFMLNKILKDGAVELGKTGASAVTGAERIAQMTASFDNFKLKLGELITPLLMPLIKALTKVIEFFTGLPKPIQGVVLGVGILTVALKGLSAVLGVMTFNPIILGLAGLAVAVGFIINKIKLAKKEAFNLNSEITKDNEKTAKRVVKASSEQVQAIKDRIAKLKEERDEVTKGSGEKIEAIKKELDEIKAGKKTFQEATEDTKKYHRAGEKAFKKEFAERLKSVNNQLKIQTNELKELEPQVEKNKKKLEDYESTAKGTFSKISKAIKDMNKGFKEGIDIEDWKKSMEDYYTYIGELRQVDIDKENERHENETAVIEELREAGKITEEEYLFALEAIQRSHLERMGEIGTEHDTLEEEKAATKAKLEEDRRKASLTKHGEYYKDLTKVQKKEIDKMLKDWKGLEITKEELSGTFVDGFLGGIDSMKSSSKDVIVSMIKQFASMIAGKLAALSALHFASFNIPAGVAALAAAGAIKALGGTIAAEIAGYAEGGTVPHGNKVVYAAAGFTPQGTDTVPAMLTPGEEVLPVPVANAYRSLMNAVAMPSAGGTTNYNNTTTTEGDNIIQNEFNNNFEGNTIDEMIEFSQNTGTDLLRR